MFCIGIADIVMSIECATHCSQMCRARWLHIQKKEQRRANISLGFRKLRGWSRTPVSYKFNSLLLYLHTSTHKGVGLIPEKKIKVGAWLEYLAKKIQHIWPHSYWTFCSQWKTYQPPFQLALPVLTSRFLFAQVMLISWCSILSKCCPTKDKVHPTWVQGQSVKGQNLESGSHRHFIQFMARQRLKAGQ